ncbi:MAG TPA: isoprenoid biosynthesis glyoxalase ElbB [Bacteroidales bacterium]|nr:isoprenoid biosynthesis glyoxalase ElbB [Bacteroidales bacterium]
MKKFAMILAGSGVQDGSEIHEATLSMLAIMQQGGSYQLFAPNVEQHNVVNHLTGEEMNEKRNVLVESARIARGQIKSLDDFSAGDFDALIIPGGFGVAKNLCNYAFKGADCSVNPQVAEAINTMHDLKKPIGALCISPVLLSKVLGEVTITIGDDDSTIDKVEEMGSQHLVTTHGEVIYDDDHSLFTTPCYMLDANIRQVYQGASALVDAMMKAMK